MYRQDGLLLDVLGCNEVHVRSRHCFTDRLGIRAIILVGLDVGFDELGCHKFDRVPEFPELPRPVVCAAAGLHANQAGFQIGEELRHFAPPQLLAQHGFAVRIYPMNLKHFFCQVDAYRSNLHFGRSSLVKWLYCYFHFGTLMPFREVGVHYIIASEATRQSSAFDFVATFLDCRATCRASLAAKGFFCNDRSFICVAELDG